MALTRSGIGSIVKNDAAPEEGKPRVYKFRANDGDFDRYNDRNKVDGWKIDNYNANPIILFNHDDGSGGWFGDGPKDVLPIGKGKAYVDASIPALMVDIEFDQDDEFAKRVESKVSKGILSAVSVRYRLTPGKYRENEKGGYDSDEQELLEISVVNIPGNQRAVRVKSIEDERAEFAAVIAKAVVTAMKSEAPVEPAPAEVKAEEPAPAEPTAQEPAPVEVAPAATELTEGDEKALATAVQKYLLEMNR